MIVTTASTLTDDLLSGRRNKQFPPDLVKRAERKLAMIDAAERLEDLRQPPGNRLHALAGNLQGFHAISINDQWRIVFRWTEHGAEDVEVIDYH